ncbi:MAG: N5-carboxyaminoimidazole ribonucleotide synthase [uncultured Sphingomonadaceae bacterium]|uniref:N5-carboxyaminoimidazole ribonucleotide synthase n=1 Tax=uncultured Sphingomonadaceae bacterium TaxID=169976 RepID=A0A6J4TC40_9SPHN|nr:MAG: N5-carboxyaminoimidazole ribonucleotide synthase [uncultured Sphingomonadaceae bacterium]
MSLPTGSTIGILGGGQLGRMLALAAAQLGYRCHVYAPEASGPATEVAAAWTKAAYDDAASLDAFAAAVDVVTYEFENIDPRAVARLARTVGVSPSAASLDAAQYRPNEKALVASLGGATAPYRLVEDRAGLDRALREIGTPAILKTTQFGYDGKGQARIDDAAEADAAWAAIGSPPPKLDGVPAILERRIHFLCEFSVLLCRGADGGTVVWDAPRNVHRDGILDRSVVPGGPHVAAQQGRAVEVACSVADALHHVGLLTCEFFATTDGPLFNEMAPRVHNSGHWTIEGAVTSQFENHIRAICGLPLGRTDRTGSSVEMVNLVGARGHGDAPLDALLAEYERAHVHLYGKGAPRPGRKMGHVTRVERR